VAYQNIKHNIYLSKPMEGWIIHHIIPMPYLALKGQLFVEWTIECLDRFLLSQLFWIDILKICHKVYIINTS